MTTLVIKRNRIQKFITEFINRFGADEFKLEFDKIFFAVRPVEETSILDILASEAEDNRKIYLQILTIIFMDYPVLHNERNLIMDFILASILERLKKLNLYGRLSGKKRSLSERYRNLCPISQKKCP